MKQTARFALVACAVLFAWSGLARAGGDDLDPVMSRLAARHHGQISFVEQHFLTLLKRPVESSGELFYDAPNRLEKRTLEPRAETLVVDDDVLTIERGGRRRVLDLQAYPQILPFVDSIRATMAGDRGRLERSFRIEFSGSVARWTLLLVPIDARLVKTVAQIQIDGSEDTLLKVDIRQTDGDRSLMTLRAHPTP